MAVFDIAFSGKIVQGATVEQVKINMAKLLRINDTNKVNMLFSGKRIILKSNMGEEDAKKFVVFMRKAGAVPEIINKSNDANNNLNATNAVKTSTSTTKPAPQTTVQMQNGISNKPRLEVKPRDGYMAAFNNIDAPDFGMQAEGTLIEAAPERSTEEFDVSKFKTADFGSNMGELSHPQPSAPKDINIKLKNK